MADDEQVVRHTRGSTLDILFEQLNAGVQELEQQHFESTQTGEACLALDNQLQLGGVTYPDSISDPPTPGGIFVSDHENTLEQASHKLSTNLLPILISTSLHN
jgi:hypothetical protein